MAEKSSRKRVCIVVGKITEVKNANIRT